MPQTDFSCPVCGADVHPNSKSCPHCGTRPEAGWATGGEIINPDLDPGIPEEDFDYQDFVSREFDRRGNLRPESTGLHKLWFFTAIALVAALMVLIALGLW